MQGQKAPPPPPGVLILAWWMEERKAGPAVASGVLLWFMLPPVGCCHCHLPSYSMSLSGPCPMATRGLKALPGGVWNILMGLSHLTIHSLSPR